MEESAKKAEEACQILDDFQNLLNGKKEIIE